MSDETARDESSRDEVVARALGTIPVPDHNPGFWDRLDQALRDQDPGGKANDDPDTAPELVVVPATSVSVFEDEPDEPAEDPAVEEVVLQSLDTAGVQPARERAARRWGVRAGRALLAVAAVVVVAVAGVVIARRDDTGPDLSSETVPAAPDQNGSDTSDTTGAPAPDTPVELTPEQQVVVDFVDALGRGDIDAAAALLGPRSEAYLEAQVGSVDDFLVTASEGYGSWSASTDRKVWTVDGMSAVVLEGTISPEGNTEYRRDVFPVVYANSAKAWFVDPWAFDPAVEDQRIEFVEPPPALDGSTVITPGSNLVVAVAGPGTVSFSIDGKTPIAVPTTSRDGSDVATWRVPDRVEDDATLVVIYESESAATFTAIALPVNAG